MLKMRLAALALVCISVPAVAEPAPGFLETARCNLYGETVVRHELEQFAQSVTLQKVLADDKALCNHLRTVTLPLWRRHLEELKAFRGLTCTQELDPELRKLELFIILMDEEYLRMCRVTKS
jgi:hypothetical protein